MSKAKIPAELRETSKVVPIDSVKPAKVNPRRGDVELIRESLRTNGQYRAIVVNKRNDEILAGNHTYRAAKEEGWSEIAISYVSATPAQARKILLVDNVANDKASWDVPELADLLRAMPSYEGTGYTVGEVDKLLADVDAKLIDPPTPAPPRRAKTRKGDLIICGRHRLLCGDSTEKASWKRLLDGDNVDLVWTDPPYGVDVEDSRTGRSRAPGGVKGPGGSGARRAKPMAGDDIDDKALFDLHLKALAHAAHHARAGAPIYMAHADSKRMVVEHAFRDAGWRYAQSIVWAKNAFVIGRQDYQWQHEVILYGWKPGAGHTWNGSARRGTVYDSAPSRADMEVLDHAELMDVVEKLLAHEEGTVIRFDRPSGRDFDHPTPKPVEMVGAHILNSSNRGAIVADPFGGTGTTMVAAEQTGRSARLIELEPRYADIIVGRWEELTGERAERPKRK